MKPKKMRRHGAAPANWQFRGGRPRWIPSPRLRAAGWRGADLKDAVTGHWLGEGASVDRSRAINAAVAAWRAGEPVPAEMAAIAPAGAAAAGQAPPAGTRSIGTLIDAYLASREYLALARKTRDGYRGQLKRLVDVLAGWTRLPDRRAAADVAAYEAARAVVLASAVDILDPPPFGDMAQPLLYTAYWTAHDQLGAHMASGMLGAASAWLQWCIEIHRSVTLNPAKLVSRKAPPGRIRVATWPEVQALVRAADALGWLSVGDAIVLGVDLSWSQCDRLALTWDRVRDGRAFTGAAGRQKTGRVGGTPFLELGLARLAEIRARQSAMAAQPTHVLWNERTAAPWTAAQYRKEFALIRERAALEVASVIDVTDQDLRDTAFTLGRDAGLNDDQTASRTLQSRKHIANLADRHYGEIGPTIADQGRDKLNAHMRRAGMVL